MPAHTGPLTWMDGVSLISSLVYLYQPGVDRKAVMQWMLDNVFGDTTHCAIWGIFFAHKITEWGGMGFYSLLYKLEIPFWERRRTFPHKPWPWNDPNPKVRKDYDDLKWRALTYIIKFHICVTILNIILGRVLIVDNPQFDPDLAYSAETVPHWFTSAWQVWAGVIIAETGFYFAHRLLHVPFLYKYHKMHHEFKDCSILATFYVHPIDALLTDIIPAGLPVVLFDMHIYTVWMYTLPLLFNACWVHCGYEYPCRFNPLLFLPMATAAETTHDVHHRCFRYNFGGAYFVWDRLLGTFRAPSPLDCDASVALKHLATLGQTQIGEPVEPVHVEPKSDEDKSQ